MFLPAERGSTLSSSSTMRQEGFVPRESRNRSLNLATGEEREVAVLYREWTSYEDVSAPSTAGRRGRTNHSHRVQSPQRLHPLQQTHHDPSSLNRLNRPRQQIRSDRLEILQHQHGERLSKNLVRILIVPTPSSTLNTLNRMRRDVRVPHISHGNEQLERVHLPHFSLPPLDLALDLALSLLPVAREAQILLVAPEHRRTRVLFLRCNSIR